MAENSTSPEAPQTALPATPFIADHPLSKLPPIAREIVEAATRVILRDGYKGLTLRSVAAESEIYADSIRYYFGGKNGLIRAVALNLSHDLGLATLESVRAIENEDERMGVIAEVNRTIAEDAESYRVYWELLPHILADPDWKTREAEDYEWYRRLYAHYFWRRPAELSDLPESTRARNLATLMIAVGDGLALQKMLDPGNLDLAEVFALWAELVRPALSRLLGTDEDDRRPADRA